MLIASAQLPPDCFILIVLHNIQLPIAHQLSSSELLVKGKGFHKTCRREILTICSSRPVTRHQRHQSPMSNSERNSHRRNNVSHRNSLVRGPDGSYGLVSTTPSAMNAAASATTSSGSGRRRKSRSPGSVTRPRTDSSTVTTAMGKKRKSAISLSSAATSSVHGPDDMIVDRGRKPKLKTKTHSRNSTENSTPAMEQQIPQLPTIPQRPSKKERSRSRGSRERGSKKFPLSESSAAVSELEKGFNSGVDAATSFTSAELLKLKKEMESLRKVR